MGCGVPEVAARSAAIELNNRSDEDTWLLNQNDILTEREAVCDASILEEVSATVSEEVLPAIRS